MRSQHAYKVNNSFLKSGWQILNFYATTHYCSMTSAFVCLISFRRCTYVPDLGLIIIVIYCLGKKKYNLYFFNYFTVLKEHDSSTFASEAREWPVESSYCINKHIELCLCPSVAHTDIGY